MRTLAHLLIIIATLIVVNPVSGDQKDQVITGQVIKIDEQNILIQTRKERVEVNYFGSKYAVKPKVGDTVTVHYTSGHHIYRADPDNIATTIEVNGAKNGSHQ